MQPYIPKGTVASVGEVLSTRWIGQGPKVAQLERRFSVEMVSGRASVAVGSGTDALHLAYLLAGIKAGDEVIAPLFTCTATNIPLLWMGAKIRFCDVGPNSLNMDPAHCRSLINERTKAIIVVHYGGAPISQEFFHLGSMVIEDCAQALGGTYSKGGNNHDFESVPLGTRGQFACFSFQAVKHIGTGDGGMLVLPESLAAKARRLRWFGIDREAKLTGNWNNEISEVGYKYQMNDVAAAMCLAGLDGMDFQMYHRRSLRSAYIRGLSGIDGVSVIDHDPHSACWLMTILAERREDLRRKLLNDGVESDCVHYRNDRYSIFRDSRGEFPNMDAIDGKYLVLPMHMGMLVEDVEHICEVARSGW